MQVTAGGQAGDLLLLEFWHTPPHFEATDSAPDGLPEERSPTANAAGSSHPVHGLCALQPALPDAKQINSRFHPLFPAAQVSSCSAWNQSEYVCPPWAVHQGEYCHIYSHTSSEPSGPSSHHLELLSRSHVSTAVLKLSNEVLLLSDPEWLNRKGCFKRTSVCVTGERQGLCTAAFPNRRNDNVRSIRKFISRPSEGDSQGL